MSGIKMIEFKTATETEIKAFIRKYYNEVYIDIFESIGVIDILQYDFKTLCSKYKHLPPDAYRAIYKNIFISDPMIIAIIAGDEIKFKYKAINLTDFCKIVSMNTGISVSKIRAFILSDESGFEFISERDTGALKLVRPELTDKENFEFKNNLIKKYALIRNNGEKND